MPFYKCSASVTKALKAIHFIIPIHENKPNLYHDKVISRFHKKKAAQHLTCIIVFALTPVTGSSLFDRGTTSV
jgi:hypothetical protein